MSRHIIIQGARIVDGTGAPWYRPDLRIADGRIARVGPNLPASGATVVEAGDCYLAPGLIDAHCHDDLITLREPQRVEKVMQGVTTVVVGNCSFSLYPAVASSRRALAEHFGALLGATADDQVFDDLARYRDALHTRGAALNTVSLVGHAALRLAVMGYEKRAATANERRAMQRLLAVQLDQGAAGLSLGLVYPPSAYADEAELVALAETVCEHGKLLTSTDEFLTVLRTSGTAGLLSHLQSAGRPNWGNGPGVIDELEAARADGLDVSFDMYPHPALLQLLPPDALAGGHAALVERLANPASREAPRIWIEDGSGDPHLLSKVSLIGWENVRLWAIGDAGLKRFEGKSIADAAAQEGIAPFELLVRLVIEDGGQAGIVLFQLNEADLWAACTHRLHLACSNGLPRTGTRPHPRGFSTFPRFAGRLVRQGWFPIEDAVRRMTSATAQRFNLADRGVIREGLVADLTLFDAAIEDRATFDDPVQLVSGVSHVFVNGEAVVADGKPTGRLPGRVIPAL